tara:strand:+ start:337 stop:1128 length:792 start_codon:yes stop_codon:yes gene_type:complete
MNDTILNSNDSDQTEERLIYESSSSQIQQRFDLRSAASQIAYPIVSAIVNSINLNKGSIDSQAVYDTIDFIYTDLISSENNQKLPEPKGEYFDALPDVEFHFLIKSADHSDVDAGYLHSDDFEDEGIIEIILHMPKDLRDLKPFLTTLPMEIRAALAHEMQHSIQRVIYGYPLDDVTNADLYTHMSSPMEIDARVEENIAYLEDNVNEDNLEKFINTLSVYVEKYLARNALDATEEELGVYKSRMMDSHTSRYIEKMGLTKVV